MAGFAQGSLPSIKISGGAEVRVFWFADCGVTTLSNGIIVHDNMLEDRPELIGPFVRASVKGFLYVRDNTDAAVDTIIQQTAAQNPTINRAARQLPWQNWLQ